MVGYNGVFLLVVIAAAGGWVNTYFEMGYVGMKSVPTVLACAFVLVPMLRMGTDFPRLQRSDAETLKQVQGRQVQQDVETWKRQRLIHPSPRGERDYRERVNQRTFPRRAWERARLQRSDAETSSARRGKGGV